MAKKTKDDEIMRAIKASSKRKAELDAEEKAKSEELHRKELGIKAFDEPERCEHCGNTDPMDYHEVSDGHECENRPAYVCDSCGWAHLDASVSPAQKVPGYSDKLEADIQISTEEAIAATIFDFAASNDLPDCPFDEEQCAQLGRDILKLVLGRFRPDLFTTG